MLRGIKIACGAVLAMGLGGCVSTALPPGTLVQPGPVAYAPPPPPPIYAAPPPPRRCFFRPGPYGPERVCRRDYY